MRKLSRNTSALLVILVIGATTTSCKTSRGGIRQQPNPIVKNEQTARHEVHAADWEPSFYKALDDRIKQINLPSLRTLLLRGNDLEARFWYDARPDIINGFVIRRSGDNWSAIGVRQTVERHFSPVKQESLGTPKSGWDVAWKRFIDAGILTLPDGSKVNCHVEVLDGGGIVVETNVMGTYRTYRYGNPQLAKCDEAKRIMTIEEIFADEFGLHRTQR